MNQRRRTLVVLVKGLTRALRNHKILNPELSALQGQNCSTASVLWSCVTGAQRFGPRNFDSSVQRTLHVRVLHFWNGTIYMRSSGCLQAGSESFGDNRNLEFANLLAAALLKTKLPYRDPRDILVRKRLGTYIYDHVKSCGVSVNQGPQHKPH